MTEYTELSQSLKPTGTTNKNDCFTVTVRTVSQFTKTPHLFITSSLTPFKFPRSLNTHQLDTWVDFLYHGRKIVVTTKYPYSRTIKRIDQYDVQHPPKRDMKCVGRVYYLGSNVLKEREFKNVSEKPHYLKVIHEEFHDIINLNAVKKEYLHGAVYKLLFVDGCIGYV